MEEGSDSAPMCNIHQQDFKLFTIIDIVPGSDPLVLSSTLTFLNPKEYSFDWLIVVVQNTRGVVMIA